MNKPILRPGDPRRHSWRDVTAAVVTALAAFASASAFLEEEAEGRSASSRPKGIINGHTLFRHHLGIEVVRRLTLALAIALLATVLATLLISAAAMAATLFETRQAESDANLPAGVTYYDDPALPTVGRDSLLYSEDATVAHSYGILSGRTITQVTVRARNHQKSSKSVSLNIVVDGRAQAPKTIPEGATAYANYTWNVSIPSGIHPVDVRGAQLSGKQQQLVVDYIQLSGNEAPAPEPTEPEPTTPESATPEPPPPTGYTPLQTCAAPSLQARIDAAPSGSTLTLPESCAFRERVTVTKPLTLVGGHIRGSDVWSGGWTQSGGNWVSTRSVPLPSSTAGNCDPGTTDCQRPEQVFVDGARLAQLPNGSDPGAGQFAIDSSRRVVLGFEPTGKEVEVSTREKWLTFGASGITVDSLEARHAMNPGGYHAALFSERANNTVKNSELSWSHGELLGMHRGLGQLAQNNHLHHAGKSAAGAYRGSLSLIGNTLHDTNIEKFNSGWDTAAVKSTFQQPGTRWANNEIYNNTGKGLWCDLECDGVLIENNRIHHNRGSAIFYEVSRNAIIRNNTIWQNGTSPATGWGAQLRLTSSDNVEVYGNVLAWNTTAISVLRTNVADSPNLPQDTTDIFVHDNVVMMAKVSGIQSATSSCERSLALAWCNNWSGFSFFPSKNNRALNNRYYFASATSNAEESGWSRWFQPSTGYTSLSAWNAGPAEDGASYLSVSEKDRIAAERNIPANP